MQNGTGLETDVLTMKELELIQFLFSSYQQDVKKTNDFTIFKPFIDVIEILMGHTQILSQNCLSKTKIAICIHPSTPKLIEIRNFRGTDKHPIFLPSNNTFLRFLIEENLNEKMYRYVLSRNILK